MSPKTTLIAGVVLGAVLIAVFWFFFYAQARSAYFHPSDWGHTLVIPFISGYFIWLKRHELLAEPFKPAWSGLLLMVVGLAIYFLGYLGPKSLLVHHNARGAGVGLTVIGLALLLFGWRAMRYLWFPLCYWVIFGQTISDAILKPVTERMQDISARGAGVMLAAIGLDIERDGNILTVYADGVAKPLNVAEACSGMRMLLAFLALGVAIAHTGLSRWWQRALLIAAGIPVAIGVNVLRVMSLGILSLWDVNFTAGNFHHVIGLVWLMPAFVIYLGILWVLRNVLIEDETSQAPVVESGPNFRFRSAARVAYGAAFAILVVGTFGFIAGVKYLHYYVVKEPVHLRAPLDSVPTKLGRWEKTGQDQRLTDEIVGELGTSRYLSRHYALDGDPQRGRVELHMAYYTGTIDDVPHVPDRCWAVAGWEPTQDPTNFDLHIDQSQWNKSSGVVNYATGAEYATAQTRDPIKATPLTVHMPVGAMRIRITEFQNPKHPRTRLLGGYLFIANGRITPDPSAVKALAFERSERFAYYCKVQFSMQYTARGGESPLPIFQEAADELLSELLPHLMARLPDWPTVEAASRPPSASSPTSPMSSMSLSSPAATSP
ncbi:MAG: exosortase/archaeosortase family protein [Phycisphaerae bacterium]|nr:exosortase/archaeosortase family protein [Phycisphaerae bacterium]